MRRTPYNERMDRSYLRVGRARNSDPDANSFRVESLRLPEDSFMTPRTPLGYYQSRGVRPLLHRPLTTQKTNPQLEHKRRDQLIQDREASSRSTNTCRSVCRGTWAGVSIHLIPTGANSTAAAPGGTRIRWRSLWVGQGPQDTRVIERRRGSRLLRKRSERNQVRFWT